MKPYLLTGLVLISAVPAVAANAATFISTSVNQTANFAINGGAGTVSSPPTGATSLPPPNHPLQAVASTLDQNTASMVNVHTSIKAQFDSANAGEVDLARGWTVSPTGGEKIDVGLDQDQSAEWTYQFGATDDGKFLLTSTVDGSGNASDNDTGLGDWNFTFIDTTAGLTQNGALHQGLTGTTQDTLHSAFNLVQGHIYVIELFGAGKNNGVTSQLTGSETDKFNWNITDNAPGGGVGGVPEPASWALMIAGFGLAGACLRRRNAIMAQI